MSTTEGAKQLRGKGGEEKGLTTRVFVREKHRSTGSHVGDENTRDVKEEEERKVH